MRRSRVCGELGWHIALMWVVWTGCGGEARPAFAPLDRPGAGNGRRDAGEADSVDGGRAGEAPLVEGEDPDDPGAAGGEPPPQTACDVFDVGAVHMWGFFKKPYDDSKTQFWAVAPELDAEQPCVNSVFVRSPQLTWDGRLLYVDSANGELKRFDANTRRRVDSMWTFTGSGSMDDEVIATPACDGHGVSVIRLNPHDDGFVYNCVPAGPCNRNDSVVLEQWCLDGPYYDEDGEVAYEEQVVAVGNDGRLLVSGGGVFRSSLFDPVTKELTPWRLPEGTPEPNVRFELGARAHEDGFWLALELRDGTRQRYFVGADGVMEHEGDYVELPMGFAPYYLDAGPVLDGDGNLFISGFTGGGFDGVMAIARTSLSDKAAIVYDLADAPNNAPSFSDPELFVRGAKQALLISAPAGRW